jgi:alginate O-acetyltransferase complex protein AlgI
VIAFTPDDWPRWAFMWLLGWIIFAACKWLTWWSALPSPASWPRQLGYLLIWPGLDAPAFLNTPSSRRPAPSDWLFALGKLGFGAALLWICVPRVPAENELLRGWVGIVGVGFVLHFGLFHLLSLFWQTLGVNAKPLMNWPILASSVSDFWGQRWNMAFRDLTYRFLFRPLTARFGAKPALAIDFLFSGIVHDLVISLPAGGGYGGPTLFFLLQAVAIFLERSMLGKRLGLGHGVRGWAFALLVLVGPAFLLFHPPFVRVIVVPFVDWVLRSR